MVHIQLEGLPPSSNHAYFSMPGGGRALTKVGQCYKNETKSFIAQKYPQAMRYFKPNMAYVVAFQFTLLPKDFYNKSFGKAGKNGPVALYKKVDVSNRVKLLEDAVKDATAIDDSCTTLLVVRKVPGDKEGTDVLIWAEGTDPFTAVLEQLITTGRP